MQAGGWASTKIRGLVACGLAVLAPASSPAIASAKPGDVDRSFGKEGKVTTGFCAHSRSFEVAMDGHRIVVAGTNNHSTNFCLARFLPSGQPDRSFGANGTVVTSFGTAAGAHAVAVDSHRRIVAAGATGSTYRQLTDTALARYRRDGTLDPSFGDDGMVTLPFGSLGAQSVAIDSHDRIVTAGLDQGDFAVARFKWNGDPDPSFGNSGQVLTDFPSAFASAFSVTIGDQDRAVVSGNAREDGHYNFALARYLPNGSPDSSFSGDGQLTAEVRGEDSGNSVAIDPKGRIVVGGSSRIRDESSRFALARYKPHGALDDSFGDGGEVTTRFAEDASARSIGIDSEGRIIATGGAFDLARYRTNGHLDRSFSGNGKVSPGWFSTAGSLAIDPRDRIVVVGWHSQLRLSRFIG
jgi:uncharacterized delta-60 repeat protein